MIIFFVGFGIGFVSAFIMCLYSWTTWGGITQKDAPEMFERLK